jgi:hypothetical protein
MSFAEHQTFHIREGWLYKGMAAIKASEAEGHLPTIFLDQDAPEKLGIGQNMVRALRFWMQATGLTIEHFENRQRCQRLTSFGQQVWQYDRYLEDEATLWLIHYHLACSETFATTWYWFFNYFSALTFEVSSAVEVLNQWVTTAYPNQSTAPGSLRKDLDCLLKTYTVNETHASPEDLIESPLSRLQILRKLDSDNPKRYYVERLNSGRLHPLILLYVLIDRQHRERNGISQVGLGSVLREPMNAGRVFGLTTTTLSDLLTELNRGYSDLHVRFVRTAGLDQLTLPDHKPIEILDRYYGEQKYLLDEEGENF